MPPGKLPELKNGSKPLGNLLNACNKPFQAQTSPPLLTMHESSQKSEKIKLELLKYTKFNIGCYTCPNEQVRYSIASY
jgi:hypothetical protein